MSVDALGEGVCQLLLRNWSPWILVINRHDLFMVFTPRRMQRGPLTVPVSLYGARGIPRTSRTKGLRNTESNVVASTYVYYAHDRVLDTLILRYRIIATLKITEVSVYGVGQVYPPPGPRQ